MPRQIIIQPGFEKVEVIETPVPSPGPKEVVIKVVVSGTNPKDWKYIEWENKPMNSGDDIAGIVHAVGTEVYEFKPGDRVAAFHELFAPNGSFAEYAVAPDSTTFHIPESIPFEEAATVPLAALTAALALYDDLKLPMPWDLPPASEPQVSNKKTPLVIYGAASATGAFAAQLARLSSSIGPIIGIAGRSATLAATLCDHIVDYRKGPDAMVQAIADILAGEQGHDATPTTTTKAPFVLDAVSDKGSFDTTRRFLDPNGGVVATLLPWEETFSWPEGVRAVKTSVPVVHKPHAEFGYVWSRYLGRLLADGRLKPHPYEVIPGGLDGVLTGLRKLREGKASGVKYVYRIGETQGL